MAKAEKAIEIQEIKMARLRVNLVGETPLIMHRFPFKAWQEMLLPSGRKNAAERAESLKHDPIGEYRAACYRNRGEKEPALFHLPSGAFSAAVASAALDIPGASKAQIERLTKAASAQVNLFGVPQMFMAMVRNSDMNRTPDVRTRPIFEEWACTLEISFVQSLIKERQVIHLLAAAGLIGGLGDWRPQKGGPFGQFKVVDDSDAKFNRIVKMQGREPQLKAYTEPTCYDDDTRDLYAWFKDEVERREKFVPSNDDLDNVEIPPEVAARATRKAKPNGKHVD